MQKDAVRQHPKEAFVADHIGIPIVLISPEGNISYANTLATELFDLEPRGASSTRCCDTLRMDICGGRCPSTRISRHYEVVYDYFVNSERSDSVYCVSTSRIYNESGEELGIVHSFKDMEMVTRIVEDHKRTQRQLESSHLKMQAILDSMADGIFTADKSGIISHFSKSMERITGYSEDEVLGKTCASVLRGELCESDCPIKCSSTTGNRVDRCQESIITKEGQPVPIAITISPVVEHGLTTGVVASVNDRTEVERLREELTAFRNIPNMIGKSPAMYRLFSLIESVSATDVTVLVEGATGTGKELVASAIHQTSARKEGPFVAVNCSALPFSLLESELFGHVRGAFSGAVSDKMGKFELADGGTLFLDEISEISEETQLKLLRFLQSKEFERVGDTITRKVDVRIVAATNRKLKDMVKKRGFRDDLFYRLNVFPIRVCPLRKRREDIPLLVDHFIQKHKPINPKIDGISTGALQALVEYEWPGNVRELENSVMYSMVSSSGRRIQQGALPSDIAARKPRASADVAVRSGYTVDDPMMIERQRIIRALLAHNWKIDETAESLGYSRITLWRRTKKLGITLPNRS